jgi:hypothetical protein
VTLSRNLLDTYYRRGWLSSGKFVAAIGLGRDLENLAGVGNERPDARLAAQERIERARATLPRDQFEMLTNILTTDALGGLAQRHGLQQFRDALALLVPIYVADGTE